MGPLNSVPFFILLAVGVSGGELPSRGESRRHLATTTLKPDDNFKQKLPQPGTNSPPAGDFLLLTNGDQIKLQPIWVANNSLALADNFYLLKPRPFERPGEPTEALGRNALSGWLEQRLFANKSTSGPVHRSKSILPADELDERQDQFGDQATGWRRPWVTEVDYALGPGRFCRRQPRLEANCLTIVWLDRANQFIRSASINLEETPVREPGSLRRRSKSLLLDEFPPISLANVLKKRQLSQQNLQLQSISCRRDGRLQVLLVDPVKNQQFAWNTHLHAGEPSEFHSILRQPEEPSSCQLEDDACETTGKVREESVKNLQQDAEWLFYLQDDSTGGRVFALNSNSHTSFEIHLEKAETRPSWWSFLTGNKRQSQRTNVTSFALDNKRKRIYLLDGQARIFSSTFWGAELKQIARLPNKLTSGRAFSMQLYQDHLLISDPIKRSLLAYKLPEVGGEFAPRILSVEMKAFYGFKVISLDSPEDFVATQPASYSGLIEEQAMQTIQGDTFKRLVQLVAAMFGVLLFVIFVTLIIVKRLKSRPIGDDMRRKIVDCEQP